MGEGAEYYGDWVATPVEELPEDSPHYWRTKDGRLLRIDEMKTIHLRNTVRFLEVRGMQSYIEVRGGTKDPVSRAEALMCPFSELTARRYRQMLQELKRRDEQRVKVDG